MKHNSIWIPKECKDFYSISCEASGIVLQFRDADISKLLRKECISFCKWLRKSYYFPVKCKLIFEHCSSYKSNLCDRNGAVAVFNMPKVDEDENIDTYPEIHVAVASFPSELKKYGMYKSVLYYCSLIAHELTHYYQWYFYETDKRSKRSLEIESNRWARWLESEYQRFKEWDYE